LETQTQTAEPKAEVNTPGAPEVQPTDPSVGETKPGETAPEAPPETETSVPEMKPEPEMPSEGTTPEPTAPGPDAPENPSAPDPDPNPSQAPASSPETEPTNQIPASQLPDAYDLMGNPTSDADVVELAQELVEKLAELKIKEARGGKTDRVVSILKKEIAKISALIEGYDID